MPQDTIHKRVLIVEDDPFLGNILKMQFRNDGVMYDLTTNAADALHYLEHTRPSLILLDILMPDVNGFAFLEQIKKDQRLQSIPVIILSNLGQESEIKWGLSLGAEKFMTKAGYDPADIVKIVKKRLDLLS